MIYLANAFSLSMLDTDNFIPKLRVVRLDEPQEVLAYKDWQSIVGHTDTARIFEQILERPVAVNRTSVSLARGDVLLVGQYSGPRLPEGATTLPEGATLKWLKVEVE